MHEDAVKARAPDARNEHQNRKRDKGPQRARVLGALTLHNISSMLLAGACELSTRARSTWRRGAMHGRFAGCNHGLRGFVLAWLNHLKTMYWKRPY
jgi:hypothetical protein